MADEDPDIKALAEGRQPLWEGTFEHPIYGPLTFRGKMPFARDLARQSVEMDNLLTGYEEGSEPSMRTLVLCASISGVKTLLQRPLLREERTEDPDDPAHVKVARVFYDADTEVDEVFVTNVWRSYSEWRAKFLLPSTQDAAKNDSGETSGDGSGTPSDEATASPSTILV